MRASACCLFPSRRLRFLSFFFSFFFVIVVLDNSASLDSPSDALRTADRRCGQCRARYRLVGGHCWLRFCGCSVRSNRRRRCSSSFDAFTTFRRSRFRRHHCRGRCDHSRIAVIVVVAATTTMHLGRRTIRTVHVLQQRASRIAPLRRRCAIVVALRCGAMLRRRAAAARMHVRRCRACCSC